jgi:hypothetical protein
MVEDPHKLVITHLQIHHPHATRFSPVLSLKKTIKIWYSDENVFQIQSSCRMSEPDGGIPKDRGFEFDDGIRSPKG